MGDTDSQPTILRQGPGFRIVLSEQAHTMSHYGAVDHADGGRNHGWIDLVGEPNRVDEVPEAARSPGLLELLRVANAPRMRYATIGCGSADSDFPSSMFDGLPYEASAYVDVTFRDLALASSRDEVIGFSNSLIDRIRGGEGGEVFVFHLSIEPLKHYFGRGDCWSLELRAFGFGVLRSEAWRALDVALLGVAAAIAEM